MSRLTMYLINHEPAEFTGEQYSLGESSFPQEFWILSPLSMLVAENILYNK